MLVTGVCPCAAQIGNLQAIAQFLCNASKSLSGTLADVLSPARMIIFGTVLTTLNKPMFAGSGAVYAAFGTVATLYWVTAGARNPYTACRLFVGTVLNDKLWCVCLSAFALQAAFVATAIIEAHLTCCSSPA